MADRVNLESVKALLSNARRHAIYFNECIHPQKLWRSLDAHDSATGEWYYTLELNRGTLSEAAPALTDCINNLVSCLDNVAGALARANGVDRSRSLYYPFKATFKEFEKSLKPLRKFFGEENSDALCLVHSSFGSALEHVAAAKYISNTGKHWELMFSNASAHGVAMNIPGELQKIVQIPANHFTELSDFEYYRSRMRLPRDCVLSVVIKVEVNGLPQGLPASPEMILDGTFRYVEAIVAAIDQV